MLEVPCLLLFSRDTKRLWRSACGAGQVHSLDLAGSHEDSDASPKSGVKWKAGRASNTRQPDTSWTPTTAWIQRVKSELPTATLVVLVQRLVPMVEAFVARSPDIAEGSVVDFLRRTTLVGLVPSPPPVTTHRYVSSAATEQWMSAYTWGQLYLRHQESPHHLFDSILRSIKMIRVSP